MKLFAFCGALLLALAASTAQADSYAWYTTAGDSVQAQEKVIQGPAQVDAKQYGHVQADCGCQHGKGSFFGGLSWFGGCCEKSASCCDHVWDGYCQGKHRHGKHYGSCGKGAGSCGCASTCGPRFSLPRIHLPKVHVDWSHCGISSGCCAPSWRRQAVPACHGGLNFDWLKRGHGCHSGCNTCDGKAFYDGGKGYYDGKSAPIYDGNLDGSMIPAPELDTDETSQPILPEDATDNSAWLFQPGLLAR